LDIFSFWDTGRKNAPESVRRSLDRWEGLNPAHRLRVLDANDLAEVLADLPFDPAALPVQARSDILRIRLLRQHGGAWADATVLPIVPLDLWQDAYLGKAGIFVYSGPPAHWRLSTFLILARPRNAFIAALDEAIRGYWTVPRQLFDVGLQPTWPAGKRRALRALFSPAMGPGYLRFHRRWRDDLLYPVSEDGRRSRFFPYFWLHYLMMSLVKSDREARAIVDAMTYRHHDLCHGVQNARRSLGPDFPKAVPMALRCAPVQKLDWRVDWPEEVFAPTPAETVLI
jgi:hypothetical protein